MVVSTIELCAGVGMLGEGVRAAFEFLGIEYQTVCYVEREAPAAAQLAALMETGALDPAPVWSDLLTFDGRSWRDKVDCITAGFPCQDISIAGRRAGLDGKRSGLFFTILDIADACGAWSLALENVSAIATATASVVDEEEGALDERAAARVVGELADRGWDSEWITLSASDVGASHGRARWFCLAWRMANTGCGNAWRSQHESRASRPEAEHQVGSAAMAHAESAEWGPIGPRGVGRIEGNHTGRGQADCWTGVAGPALALTSCDGRNKGRTEPSREQGRPDAAECGSAMADTGQPRLPQPEQRDAGSTRRGIEGRTVAELRGAPLFAPGPADPIWAGIIAAAPWLAPAIADPSGDPEKRRLNPRFVEWLMGWPIGWTEYLDGATTTTCRSDQQGCDSKTCAACNFARWRQVLTVRLAELLGEAPPRLHKADRSGWNLGAESGAAIDLPGMRDAVPAEAIAQSDAVRQAGMPGVEWQGECSKAMENKNHRLRQGGNGVVPLCAAIAFVVLLRRAGIMNYREQQPERMAA